MADRILTKDDIAAVVRQAAGRGKAIVPALKDGRVSFEEAAADAEPFLGPGISTRSPKRFFFPPSEVLLTYKRTDRGMELDEVAGAGEGAGQSEEPVLLFGVRPCTGRALSLLDKLFDSEDYRDPSYIARRASTTVVGLACSEPLSTCFCTSTGGDPFSTDGLDALVSDLGDGRFLVKTLTEKGEAVFGSVGSDAGAEDTSRLEEVAAAAREKLGEPVPVKEVVEKIAQDFMGAFESDVWDAFHEKCLGCAACAFICPTCHCFNIADESTLSGDPGERGKRVRTWDCCMFPLFTKHVSGHNPRESTRERMRQRVMHKFQYYVSNFGEAACVGCGRCVRSCPVNNDLREALRTLAARELAPAG